MSTTQLRSSRVKWVNNVKNETHQLLREFGQEGKERVSAVKQNASAVKLFLAESEKDRLATARETMTGIKNKLQQLRQEEKGILKNARDLMRKIAEENEELAGGVKRFLTHSETERRTDYKAMMAKLHQGIAEIRERTKEIRKESIKLLEHLAGETGTLKTEMKKFLSESESTRKSGFNKMMSEVKAVVNEIRDYEREERRLAGGGIKEVPGYVVKKKAAPHKAKPKKKAAMKGKMKVEAERKKLMPTCKKCGIQHWSFQKCPQGTSPFKKKKIT